MIDMPSVHARVLQEREREKREAYIRQVSKFTAGCGDRWHSEALKNERQEDVEESERERTRDGVKGREIT